MPKKHESMTPAVKRAMEGKPRPRKPSYLQLERELQQARSLITELKDENFQLRQQQGQRRLGQRALDALTGRNRRW